MRERKLERWRKGKKMTMKAMEEGGRRKEERRTGRREKSKSRSKERN